MGDRANVEFVYENGEKVYFYAHWGGFELHQVVADALDRGQDRWDDEQYLARIIFSEMVKDSLLDTTGYGIAPYIGDGDVAVVIDAREQTANGKTFIEFIAKPTTKRYDR